MCNYNFFGLVSITGSFCVSVQHIYQSPCCCFCLHLHWWIYSIPKAQFALSEEFQKPNKLNVYTSDEILCLVGLLKYRCFIFGRTDKSPAITRINCRILSSFAKHTIWTTVMCYCTVHHSWHLAFLGLTWKARYI